jgi:hypothetical protein
VANLDELSSPPSFTSKFSTFMTKKLRISAFVTATSIFYNSLQLPFITAGRKNGQIKEESPKAKGGGAG